MQLIVSVGVGHGDSAAKEEHHHEHWQEDLPLADSKHHGQDDDHVGAHLKHLIRAVEDLTVEDIQVIHEDLDDLAERRDIEEDIDGGEQDSSERHSVHISADGPLGLLEEDFARLVQHKRYNANCCDS